MSKRGDQSARGFAAGVFIGLAIVMPVFAATTPELEQWALPLMTAATMLLVVGMIVLAAGLSDVHRESPPLAVRAQSNSSPAPSRRERRVHSGAPRLAARQPG